MKNIFNVLLVLILITISPLFSQVQDEPLFGTFANPVDIDTITITSDTLYSRPIIFADLNNMEGSLSISGYIKRISGTDTLFYCELRMIPDVTFGQLDYDIWRSLGSISLSDSTRYYFNVANYDWWSISHGYQVRFYPVYPSGTFKIKARGLSK